MILNSKLDPKKSVIGINYSSSNSSSGVVLEEALFSTVLQMVISTPFIAGMAEKTHCVDHDQRSSAKVCKR